MLIVAKSVTQRLIYHAKSIVINFWMQIDDAQWQVQLHATSLAQQPASPCVKVIGSLLVGPSRAHGQLWPSPSHCDYITSSITHLKRFKREFMICSGRHGAHVHASSLAQRLSAVKSLVSKGMGKAESMQRLERAERIMWNKGAKLLSGRGKSKFQRGGATGKEAGARLIKDALCGRGRRQSEIDRASTEG